jgi:NAD(P)-dependent dehydrogenase (short-subunit alcohol dehydrogenase family)
MVSHIVRLFCFLLTTLTYIAGTDYTEHKSQPYPFIDPLSLNLEGKSVFITGASKGIGAAIATSYAKAGASIIGIGSRTSQSETIKAIQQVAKTSGRSLSKILSYEVDVTNPRSVEQVATRFREDANGRLDILVNNAGYLPRFTPIVDSEPDDWWRGWEVNVKGVFLLTRSMLPIMLSDERSDRTVVTLTSTSAHRVSYGGSSYQITKLVNLRFSEFIGAEYGQHGVLAYSVNPGRVATDMGAKVALDTGIRTFLFLFLFFIFTN